MPCWWEKLWPLLVDKVLLGAVGVLIGFVFARKLERFRRVQTGIAELVKARIGAVNEVYAALFDLADGLGYEEVAAIPGVDSRQIPPPPAEEGDVLYAKASKVIARNRFLVGQQFYATAVAYLDALQKCRVDVESLREIGTDTWKSAEAAFAALEEATPAQAVLPENEMPKPPKRKLPAGGGRNPPASLPQKSPQ